MIRALLGCFIGLFVVVLISHSVSHALGGVLGFFAWLLISLPGAAIVLAYTAARIRKLVV